MNISENSTDKNNLKSLLSQLGKKLISYQVIDRQNTKRGIVKDVYNDSRGNIYLLLELATAEAVLRRLSSDAIAKLDLDNKIMQVDLSKEQIEALPVYKTLPSYLQKAVSSNTISATETDAEPAEIKETYNIPLLEEKLKVKRHKRKVGEVIVRKHVETRMVQIPVRREKLIIERVGKNSEIEKLSSVDLGEGEINGTKFGQLTEKDKIYLTKSNFVSLQTARDLLDAIAGLSSADHVKVSLEIVSGDRQQQTSYQNICDRYLS